MSDEKIINLVSVYHSCAICKRSDIRLYRPGGEFLRDERIRCRKHIPSKDLDLYVPMVEDLDGTVWGITSIPKKAYVKWKNMEDNCQE